MKLFLKILAIVLAVIILTAVGLNIYFTDERLKQTVMPKLNDAIGRTVEVESMSLTFFSSFPQPGISIQKMTVPGATEQDTLLSLDELVVSVELFSLMGDQIEIANLGLRNPHFTYIVLSDSTTNVDFLMAGEESDQESSGELAVNIPSLTISGGQFGFRDSTANTYTQINDLNADVALRYADTIESLVDLKIGGISATAAGTQYLNNLPVDLRQESTIELNKEKLTLKSGTLSIRGLALELAGTVSNWSNKLSADLSFSSSSDNFGELLRLVPAGYEQQIKGLETKGSLAIDGKINGPLGGDELPQFDFNVDVTDGYLKNPDLPRPIEQIQLKAQANNDLLTLNKLTAKAGENNISATGELTAPIKEDGIFSVEINGDVNLATVSEFYDISQFDIENMGGSLKINAKANGNRATPEKATFNAVTSLKNGRLKYADVPKAIENITVEAQANQERITIDGFAFETATNTFSMQGVVNQPLKEQQRTVDLNTELEFDLATIKEFYPIDEDTLKMRGQLSAKATLNGKADQIERAIKNGNITLKNGFIDHKSLGKPIRELSFSSSLNGPVLSIQNAVLQTGDNNLSITGDIRNYLNDNRTVDLVLKGKANLAQIPKYYKLEPNITELTGTADLNLKATGPVSTPSELAFNGAFTAQKVNMDGQGMVQPLKNLNGKLSLTPLNAELDALAFNLGSSDIALNGSLKRYMEYLKAESKRTKTPQLSGSYSSKLLNLDELIDWNDTTETTATPIHLPDLTSSVTADIDELIVTAVPMKKLQAKASTTPEQIKLNKASVQLFEGEARGAFTWKVPTPKRTNITFSGTLDSLQASSFFREYPILGEDSKFHEYISGAFTANVDYSSDLDVYLQPVMNTTVMNGDFGMTKARLKGHPIQKEVASSLKTKEFRNIALDEWTSTYTLKDNIFTLKDLRLTSGNIGAEMNGTQHMQTGKINFQLKLFLPGRFKKGIADVITKQAADALTQENGTIMVPLRLTGTHENPNIRPDKKVIAPIVEEYLKDKAGNVLEKLFDG